MDCVQAAASGQIERLIVLTDTLNHIALLRRTLFLVCAFALLMSSARADEPSKVGAPEVKQEDAEAVPKFDFAAAAAGYEISIGKDRLICEPFQIELLKWSNPVRGSPAGTVFLWHHKGAPQAACCMFSYKHPEVKGDFLVNHEFVSLSTDLIESKSNDGRIWKTTMPGIAWQEIPESPPIAKTRPARLAQMRDLASKFTGQIGKANNGREELRLLRQPIYRYPETSDRDGAIFVFAQTTDPEILLLLQTDPLATGSQWSCAFARMTMFPCWLSHREKELWSVPSLSPKVDSDTYRTFRRVPWKAVEEK